MCAKNVEMQAWDLDSKRSPIGEWFSHGHMMTAAEANALIQRLLSERAPKCELLIEKTLNGTRVLLEYEIGYELPSLRWLWIYPPGYDDDLDQIAEQFGM